MERIMKFQIFSTFLRAAEFQEKVYLKKIKQRHNLPHPQDKGKFSPFMGLPIQGVAEPVFESFHFVWNPVKAFLFPSKKP
jgi:hypothetical protein